VWLARATQGHGMVQGFIGEKVISEMVDDIIEALLRYRSEFYTLEFIHVQCMCDVLMPETRVSFQQGTTGWDGIYLPLFLQGTVRK
jgi:hypothetical protein